MFSRDNIYFFSCENIFLFFSLLYKKKFYRQNIFSLLDKIFLSLTEKIFVLLKQYFTFTCR